MEKSENSFLSGKENETVPGGEEQSSQTSSWWPLTLIALCAVTTILDKRRRHPSLTPTGPQDEQTIRGQREYKGKGLKETSLEHEDGQPPQKEEAIPQEDWTQKMIDKLHHLSPETLYRIGNIGLILVQALLFLAANFLAIFSEQWEASPLKRQRCMSQFV